MNQSTSARRPLAALALILIHLIVSIPHGWAHQAAMVTLTTFGNIYVGVVITLMPVVAAVFLFTGKNKDRSAVTRALDAWQFCLRILVSLSFTDQRQRYAGARAVEFNVSLDGHCARGH